MKDIVTKKEAEILLSKVVDYKWDHVEKPDLSGILKAYNKDKDITKVPNSVSIAKSYHTDTKSVIQRKRADFITYLGKKGVVVKLTFPKNSRTSASVNRKSGVIRISGRVVPKAVALSHYSSLTRFEFLKGFNGIPRADIWWDISLLGFRYKTPKISEFLTNTSIYSTLKDWCGFSFPKPLAKKLRFSLTCFVLNYYTKSEVDRLKDSIIMGLPNSQIADHIRIAVTAGEKPRLFYNTKKAFFTHHNEYAQITALRGVPDISMPEAYPERLSVEGLDMHLISTKEELVKEGALMKHCVASYASGINAGNYAIYRAEGEDRLTLQVAKHGDNLILIQAKGKLNSQPKREVRESLESFFVNNEKTPSVHYPNVDVFNPEDLPF